MKSVVTVRALLILALLILALLAPLAASPALAQREAPTAPTAENIKAQCWMKYEGQRKLKLDQRLALVEKCIEERTKGQR
jgi:hypothetical protein